MILQGTAIDLILLRVNGGVLSDDGAVQRADIRAFLPVAINFATSKAYYTNRKEEGDRDFPSDFYGTFSGLTIDRAGLVAKIILPKQVVSLPSNQGVRFVTDLMGNTYTPVSDADYTMINYYSKIFHEEKFYRRIDQTILLWNLQPLVTQLDVIAMIDPTEFNDDTLLPIQAGMEDDVITMCVEHFTGQRQQPADATVNTKDLNAQ